LRKRILAWIALVIFILIMVNMMFIHYRVTESITVFLLYVLFFFYYDKRQRNGEFYTSGSPENNGDPDDKSESDTLE
jgi:predicted membrane protein